MDHTGAGFDADAGLNSLLELVDTLRGKAGCPWDRRQTPQTLKKYLLEECQELVEAIEQGDAAAVREESGDLLFLLVFLIRLYEEQGGFDLAAVCSEAHAKMVRRHPHVFGDAVVASEAELYRQWDEIKAAEKKVKQRNEGV
ncbi:MAG: MazG nucleotide pyrophosphohydrolase domain-containing protein [Desulfobulbus sp.]|jgi:uncharacterized protein YabN with tetrapyrrole methylase and pyrophosphatase domain|nr:nucleotide pyrophosphohydrolase [Desulfobulbaceae bacterium]